MQNAESKSGMPGGGKRIRTSKTRLTPLQDKIIRSILLDWGGAETFRELIVTGVRDQYIGGAVFEASTELPRQVAHAVIALVKAGYLRISDTVSADPLTDLLTNADRIKYDPAGSGFCCDADLAEGPRVWTTEKAARAYSPVG